MTNTQQIASYIVEVPSRFGGRPEQKIDLPRFAADLAQALDTLLTSVEVSFRRTAEYANERQTIQVGADHLNLSADNHKRRVTASIAAPDVPWDDRNTYDRAHRTESATVNPDGRSIAVIAADVNRRVIEASQEALRLQREHSAKQVEGRASIVRLSAALKARLPGLDVRTNEKEQRAALYSGSTGHYLAATLSRDATVSVERIGSMTLSQFERIVAILNDGKKA